MSRWLLPGALGKCTLLQQTPDHHEGHIASPGELYIGGQEHFYLETHCTIAVPKGEAGEMELFVSTQNTTKTQVPSCGSAPGPGHGTGEHLAD